MVKALIIMTTPIMEALGMAREAMAIQTMAVPTVVAQIMTTMTMALVLKDIQGVIHLKVPVMAMASLLLPIPQIGLIPSAPVPAQPHQARTLDMGPVDSLLHLTVLDLLDMGLVI